MEYRKDIQGLRALAVLLIYIFHLNPNYLSGGFIGVDVFFVISGYLISANILEKKGNKNFNFISFYKSRIKRIVPVYFFALIIISILVPFIFWGSDVYAYRKGLFYSILFYSNNYFANLNNYFGASSMENPLLHTWSLAIEMQFYLFLPILLVLTKRKYLQKLIVFTIITLFIYGSYVIIIKNNQSLMYYSLIARTPEFLLGTFFYIIRRNGLFFTDKRGFLTASIGISLILISAFLFNDKTYFPGFSTMIPCVGTGLLLISGFNTITNFFSKKIPVFIGELSYSIYLWHWPIMAILRYQQDSLEFNFSQILIITISTISLSLFSYYTIENRMRKKTDSAFVLSMITPSVLIAIFILTLPKINNKIIDLPSEYITPSTITASTHGENAIAGIYGDRNDFNEIFLTGDSHALVLIEWLDEIAKENNFSFRSITSSKYPPISGIKESDVPSTSIQLYRISHKLTPIVKEEVQKSSIIFIVCSDWDKAPSLLDALDNFINKLQDSQDLIILGTFPEFYKNPIQINRSIIRNDTYSHEMFYIDNSNLLKLISNRPNVHYYDLSKNDIFKEAPYFNDTLSYYDAGHLNVYGAKKLAKANKTDFMDFFYPILSKHQQKTN